MIQAYWDNTPRMEGVREVVVLSRAVRRQCEHDWRRRVNRNRTRRGDSWRRVCRNCGACAR